MFVVHEPVYFYTDFESVAKIFKFCLFLFRKPFQKVAVVTNSDNTTKYQPVKVR